MYYLCKYFNTDKFPHKKLPYSQSEAFLWGNFYCRSEKDQVDFLTIISVFKTIRLETTGIPSS